jgi:hypothetical protein
MDAAYSSGSETIEGYGPLLRLESEQVFAPGMPALLVATQSGGGKTVAAVDMVLTASKHATGFTYVTNSYDSSANAYLRQMVPAIHVKNWSVQFICSLWRAILDRGAEIGRAVDDASVAQFMSGRCQSAPTLQTSIDRLHAIARENAGYFPDGGALREAMAAHEKLLRLRYIADNFRADDQSLSERERSVVRAASASKPCYLLLFDDVTAQIRNPPNEEIDIPQQTESGAISAVRMKGKAGFESLLFSILTLARHYAIVGFFVHSLDVFSASVRSQFGGILLMGEDVVQQAWREQTLSPQDKDLIVAAWAVAKRFPYHKVILFPNPELTEHRQRVALFRPTYHPTPSPIGVPTYQRVMTNLQGLISRSASDQTERARTEVEKKRKDDEMRALVAMGTGARPPVPMGMGASPMGASPMGASPMGASPMGASPMGMGASPMGMGASPMGSQPSGDMPALIPPGVTLPIATATSPAAPQPAFVSPLSTGAQNRAGAAQSGIDALLK